MQNLSIELSVSGTLMELRSWNFTVIYASTRTYVKIFPLGGVQGRRASNVHLKGPPNISETTTATKLKLKIQLDVVKYSLCLQKIPLGGIQGVQPPM